MSVNTVGVLRDPHPGCKRGNFHQRYLLEQAKLDHRHDGWRLLDCLLVVVPETDPDYFDEPDAGEFAVVDVLTREKAFFDMPHGCTPAKVTEMARSHFASMAYQVGPELWFV